MKSPFPGMDPYLEDPSVWEEFHHVFVTECMYFLSDRLPDGYIAKIGERVELITLSDEAAAQYVPDTAIALDRAGRRAMPAARQSAPTAILAPAPVTIRSMDSLEIREGHVEILRLPGHHLVTSIEVLSPWNKYGEGVGEYRHKRRALTSHGVHVVEIDLLRRGKRTELAEPLPAGDYFALVFRADRRPDVQVYHWEVRDPLPPVAIPLQAPDADVVFELGTVVATAYDRGHCDRKLRYSGLPPPPSLGADAAAWVEERLKSVGMR